MTNNLAGLIGETEFWRLLAVLTAVAGFVVMAIPGLADLVARGLHAHSIAVSAAYKVLVEAGRAYRRVFAQVMQETAQ